MSENTEVTDTKNVIININEDGNPNDANNLNVSDNTGMVITSSGLIFSNLTIPSLSDDDPLNTPVIDICSRYLLLIPDTTKIEDVLIKLHKFKSQSFVVTNEYNEYVRFYTQKDIYYKVVFYGKMNESFTLKDLIKLEEKNNSETQCVSNTNTLIECLSIMKENNVESIAVAEGVTGITGIISLDDITEFLSEQIKLKRNPPRKLTPFEQKIDNLFGSIFFQVAYIIVMLAGVAICALSFTHVIDELKYNIYIILINRYLTPIPVLIMFIISLLRIKLVGIYYLSKRDILEALALFLALIFSILYIIPIEKEVNNAFYFTCSFCLAFEIFCVIPCRVNETRKKMKSSTKKAVSRNKARYRKDGFDLDLTYITPRCIAMSLPADTLEMLYRNPIREVARFFDTKHPDCYRIYNLCNERNYSKSFFHGNVVKFPIPDHNVPTLKIMLEFSKDARSFFAQNTRNVIAVHCKGGKGRTGCMVCAYLINSGVCKTADEALDRFAAKRTFGETKDQGVTCPSQKRFVHYYEKLLNDLFVYYNNPIDIINIKDEEMEQLFNERYNKEITVERITVYNLPKMKSIRFRIVDYKGKELYTSKLMDIKKPKKNKTTLEPNLKLRNEFRFELKGKFYLWQHSYFVSEREIYNKHDVDGICNNPNYSDSFCLEFIFK